jgi:hypothetical protein
MVTLFAGKPCMLKCHVYYRPGRPGKGCSPNDRLIAFAIEGRQIDPNSNVEDR